MPAVHSEIPSHVPAHLVHNFETFFSGTSQEVLASWKSLHNDDVPRIFWTPEFGGHWLATRADDIEEIYKDYDSFTSTFGISLPLRETPGQVLPIFCDPPEHSEYRRLISSFFTPKKIVEVEKVARALAREIIDSLIDKGECEFFGQFATFQPIQIFLELAGLPISDWETLQPWGDIMARESDVTVVEAVIKDAWAYMLERVQLRRLQPGDDPLTTLVQGEAFGRKLTDDECVGNTMTVLFAGIDTTPSTLTFIAHFLATHPEHRRTLVADRSRIPAACDEFLRRFPPTVQGRVVRNDMEFRGVTMKAGDFILMPGVLANLDEQRFPDPMTVDFGRIGLTKSVTFGAGIHRCPGAMLARMQIKIFLEEWLERIPDFWVAEGDRENVRCGNTMVMDHLPLQWRAQA